MTRLAQVVFALLVLATAAAFFGAQKLKTAPPVLLAFRLSSDAISPNGDGRFEREEITFRLKRRELFDVAVVDQRGDVRVGAEQVVVEGSTEFASGFAAKVAAWSCRSRFGLMPRRQK